MSNARRLDSSNAALKTLQSLALFGLTALALPAVPAEESVVLPASEPVAGLSQEDWSRAWWQWAHSFETSRGPVADRTGELCGLGQSGPVWFLAGTYGTKRTIRTCSIPRGRYLFFPLINYAVMPPPGRPVTCDAVKGSAARLTDHATGLVLEIDGVRTPDLMTHRLATSECFDIGVLVEPKVRIFPSAANGYYVMVRPLASGTHTLEFGGVLPDSLQGVTYTLIVE